MRRGSAAMALVAACFTLSLVSTMPARGQLKKKGLAAPQPAIATGLNPATQYSGIKLVEKSEYRQIINVAQECIRDAVLSTQQNKGEDANRAWNEAATAIQTILDHKEDFYVQVKQRDSTGADTVRWTSVKYEANNLLGSMPRDGLAVYEVRFGGKAKQLLEEAKEKGDREILADVANRYLHTQAGGEANELLATYFLDRGQFFTAALRFDRILQRSGERTPGDLVLFKTALALRRAGEVKKAEEVWKQLEASLQNKGGLKIGDQLVPIPRLQQVLDDIPRPEAHGLHDWPYIRGDITNTAQAQGSPPLLDMELWKRPLFLDEDDLTGKEARERVNFAIQQQLGLPNTPIMSGFFPIAAGKLLVYRSYADVRAVHLHDEKDAAGKVVAKAGDIAWKSIEFDGSLATALANSKTRGSLDNWLTNSWMNLPVFSNLVYENTLQGTLCTDHRLVYAIDDLAVPCPPQYLQQFPWAQGQVSQEVKALVLQNSLYAFNLQTGNFIWRLGDPNNQADPAKRDDPFNDSHFLGVPLSVGGKLYVLNEKNNGPTGDAELRLVAIDPQKGAVIPPIQSLGMVQQQYRVTHDVSRRINAVHLAYGEGILVCPTNAGEVLGVDLLTRTLAWAYPYREKPSSSAPLKGLPQVPQPFPGQPNQLVMNVNWKSAPPAIADGKVVFTAPDAHSIHCINLRDGTKEWSKGQVEGDLFLAGVYQGKVLIVGKNAVRILRLQDGTQISYLPTGDLPSGHGVASKNIYYLPLRRGEIVAIDIDKLAIKAHNRAKKTLGSSPGNLVFYEGTVLSQTPRELVAFPQLVARLELANRAVLEKPNDPERWVERGEYRLADGQVQAAVDDLQKALEFNPPVDLARRAKNGMFDALTDLFNIDYNHASTRYQAIYWDLCNLPDGVQEKEARKSKFYRLNGQGREAQGNLVEAFKMYKAFGDLDINKQGIANIDDPTHKVPTSVWLRGRISAMMARASPEQRAPLESQIAQEWRAVQAKNDVDAIRNFVGMFDVPFAVGREARMQLAETLMAKEQTQAFLEAELSLQQLRIGELRHDAKVGGRALAALIALEEQKGKPANMVLAAAYRREIARSFPDAVVRNGKTGKDLLNELAEDKRYLPHLEESGGYWNRVKIAARELPSGAVAPGPMGFVFLPASDLAAAPQSYRLVLDSANSNSPKVSLVDLATGETRWTQGLGTLPANQAVNLQYFSYLSQQASANAAFYPNARFRFYHAKGHLAVFQVGTMTYCFDMDSAKILWHYDLLAGNPVQPPTQVQSVHPDQDGNLEMLLWNQFTNQRTTMRLGQVGAVEAAYVALVTHKGLVVLDPLRGTEMWSKMDVPAVTQVFGDDQHLYLVEMRDGASAGVGRALRASDGVAVDVPDFGYVYQNRLRIMGRKILAAVHGKDSVQLRLYDAHTGKDAWTKTFDARAIVLKTEEPSLSGVIDGAGKLIVLNAEDGQEILSTSVVQGRVTLDDLKNVKDPLLLHDSQRFYLALNKPVDTSEVSGGIVSNNFANGLRCAPVNGWVMAFHRADGDRKDGDRVITWKKGGLVWHSYVPLSNQMIVLEQFQNLPVMLFSARYNKAAGNAWVSVTKSIHKATGKVVFDQDPRSSNSAAQFYSFTIDVKAGTINMVGYNGAIQHYVDDGRKLPEVSGAFSVPAPPDTFGGAGMRPPGFAPPAGGAIIIRPVRPIIMPVPEQKK